MAAENWRARAAIGAVNIATGFVFVAANFSGILKHLAAKEPVARVGLSDSLLAVSNLSRTSLGSSTVALHSLLAIGFFGLWVFLGTLALQAMVRKTPILFLLALSGILLGLFSLPILSWISLALWFVLLAVFWIVRLIGVILAAIFGFIAIVFSYVFALFQWIFLHFWPILAVCAIVVAVIFLLQRIRLTRLIFPAVIAIAAFLLRPVFRWIWESIILPACLWLKALFLPILHWIGHTLGFIGKYVLILAIALWFVALVAGILGLLGCLVTDQLRTAWELGRSRKGILVGSFSIGTSLALILLVSTGAVEARNLAPAIAASITAPQSSATAAKPKKHRTHKKTVIPPPAAAELITPSVSLAATIDQAWNEGGWFLHRFSITRVFTSTLPKVVMDWSRQAFTHASAPTFDAIIFLAIILISVLSAFVGMFLKDMPMEIKFYNRDLVILAVIPIAVVIAVVSASEMNQD